MYSTAVSLLNWFPAVPLRMLIVGVSVAATGIALVLDLTRYQQFLLLLGAFFVPLFGVLLADWLFSGAHYTRTDVFRAPDFRAAGLTAWLAGFAAYQWLQPTGPSWWTHFVGHAHPGVLHIGASLPSFAIAFALAALAKGLTRRATVAGALSR